MWKKSHNEFKIEKEPIKLPKEKSTSHKVWQAEYFHKHGEISRMAKVFTNDSTPTSDPVHYELLQQLFPLPVGCSLRKSNTNGRRLPTTLDIRNWDQRLMGHTTGIRKDRKPEFHSILTLSIRIYSYIGFRFIINLWQQYGHLLVCRLPLHRHSYIGFIFSFRFIDS